MAQVVYLKKPGGEIREVEATPEALTPLLAAGYHQVPAPAGPTPETLVEEEK